MKVLDISHYQTVKDWAKIAKEVSCVILKATQGVSYVDPTFYKYRVAARNAGLLVGAYHFADGEDVEREVDHFIETVGELLEGEFLVLDYEIHLADPLNWCGKFLNRCEIRTGIRPLLYINTSTFKSYKWQKENLWLASYGVNDGKEHPIPYPYVMHQYTSRGAIGGIDGYVDLSVGDIEELRKLGKKIAIPETPKPEVLPDVYSTPENPVAPPNIASGDVVVTKSIWQDAILEIVKLIKSFYNIIK
jgi:lysozyme